jgi:DNA replication protein DnaC
MHNIGAAPTMLCKKCKGRGFLATGTPYGSPEFGKYIPCECIQAAKKAAEQAALEEASGILAMKRFKDASFTTFDADIPGVMEAWTEAIRFAEQSSGYDWLILEGPYGCGKTHLATAIARYRLATTPQTVLIETVPDLLDRLRAGFKSETYDERFEQAKKADLVVLDDYGAQNDTDWAYEKMFQLLNYRYNRCAQTVITSNDLAGIDPRIWSRMHDRGLACIVHMDRSRDYRLYGAQE